MARSRSPDSLWMSSKSWTSSRSLRLWIMPWKPMWTRCRSCRLRTSASRVKWCLVAGPSSLSGRGVARGERGGSQSAGVAGGVVSLSSMATRVKCSISLPRSEDQASLRSVAMSLISSLARALALVSGIAEYLSMPDSHESEGRCARGKNACLLFIRAEGLRVHTRMWLSHVSCPHASPGGPSVHRASRHAILESAGQPESAIDAEFSLTRSQKRWAIEWTAAAWSATSSASTDAIICWCRSSGLIPSPSIILRAASSMKTEFPTKLRSTLAAERRPE